MKNTLILFRYAHGAVGITNWGLLLLLGILFALIAISMSRP